MANVAFVSRAGDDGKRPEENRCIGANDEKNGPSDDLSACVEDKRILFGCLHLSRGKCQVLIRLIPTDPPPRIIVDLFPWISASILASILASISQVSGQQYVASSQRIFMPLLLKVSQRFPKFPIFGSSSTSGYLSTFETDFKAPHMIEQNIGTPEHIHFYQFSSILHVISIFDSNTPLCLLLR